MERKYYRQYENFQKVIPRQDDFPVLEFKEEVLQNNEEVKKEVASVTFPGKINLDDIIIIALLIMLLSENEKDSVMIIVLAFLFLAEYIF